MGARGREQVPNEECATRSTGVQAREFLFTDSDFERVRGLIYRRAGIALSAAKRDMVYSRLARRLRANRLDTFRDYLALLDDANAGEWEPFTNALTTNLTSFFREEHHFPILAEHARERAARHIFKVWCCAASTGEEPYSIAMTLVEAFGGYAAPVRILATDLDTDVLTKAEHGVYALERTEKLAPARLRRFFERGRGAQAGYVRVRAELRALVTFRRLNLLDPDWPLRGPLDAIFCRNVMIYFDRPTQHRILTAFAPLLHRDGLLFAGHSESLGCATDLFRPRGKTVYQVSPRATAL